MDFASFLGLVILYCMLDIINTGIIVAPDNVIS